MASFWNYMTGKKATVERSRVAGLQLLSQSEVIVEHGKKKKKKLGEGSYAKVYVGKYQGKERAVKVFNEGIFSSEKVKEEFEKLNSFTHPNIVRVYGMWEDPHRKNSLAIVMELCDGSLYQFIDQSSYKGISSEQKLKILHDITCAMVYLHSQNVVHGDLRSPNVLVNKTNDEVTAKLTDFGRARLLKASTNAHYTMSPIDEDYLPPEVYNHDEYKSEPKNYARLTRQVDVFFFGPITIQLTCGQFPKAGPKVERKKGEVVRTFSEVERREKHLMMIKPGDRMYVDLIIEQCMADNPADRASFEELQLMVEGFQKKYDKRPDKELLEEKQREVEYLKSAIEADQITLNCEVQREQVEKECQKLKEETKEKSEQLATAEESLRKAYEEFGKLKDVHGERMAEYGTLQLKHAQMEDDKTELQSSVGQSTQQCTELQREKSELQSSLAKANSKISELEIIVKDANRDSLNNANHLQNAKTYHEQEIENLKKAQQTVQEKLQEDLQLLEEEKEKIEMDLSKAQHTSSEYEKELTDLKRDNIWSKTRINEMEAKLRVAETQAQNIQFTQKRKDEELQEMEKQRQQLEKENTELKNMVEKAEAALSETDASQKRKEQGLKNMIEQLWKTAMEMKTELEKTKRDYEHVNVQVAQGLSAKAKEHFRKAIGTLLQDKQKMMKDKVKQAETLARQTRVAKEKVAVELQENLELFKIERQQLEEKMETLEDTRKEKDSLQLEKKKLVGTAEKLKQEHMEELLRRDEKIAQLMTSLALPNPQIAALTEEKDKIQSRWEEDQEAFTMQKDKLEKQLGEAEKKAASFEKSYLTLDEDLSQQTDKHEDLQRKLDLSKLETKARGDELKVVQSELMASQTTASKLEQQLSGANQFKSTLEKEKALLKAEVQSKEREYSSLRSAETRYESLQQKLKTTESQLSKLKAEQSRTSSDMKGKDADLRQLKSDLKEANDTLKARDVDIKKLKHDIKLLNGTIQFTEKKVKEEKQKNTSLKLQTQVRTLEAEVRSCKVELQKAREVAEQQQAKNKSLEGKLTKAEFDEQDILNKHDMLYKEVGLLKAARDDLVAEKGVLTSEKDHLQNQNSRLDGERNSLQEERDDLVAEKGVLTSERDHLQNQNSRLNGERNSLQEERDDLVAEKGVLTSEKDHLQNQNSRLDGERNSLQEERDDLVAEKGVLTSERDHLQNQNSRLNGERNSLQVERDDLVAEKGDLTSDRDRLAGENSSLKVTEQSLRQETDSLVKERDSLWQERSAAMTEVEISFKQHEERKNEWETTNKDLGDRLESLELKLHLKEEEVTQLRATIERNEVRIQDAKKELSDLETYRKRVEELRKQLKEAVIKASQYKTTISELETKRNSQTTEESQQRQDIEGPLRVEIKTLKERLSQREVELRCSNGRISVLDRDIDASKAHSAKLQTELNYTGTELTSTRAERDTALAGLSNTQTELSNTQAELQKAQQQNEASSIRCQELRQHIAELESAQSRLQKREEDLNQQVEVLKSERDTAQRQAQDFDRGSRDLKLKLQTVQSDYENEQKNHVRERGAAKLLKIKNAQLTDSLSSRERDVQALKDKGRHRCEVMQQMVKSMQAQVAAVRSDMDQERSRQSDLKDSVELLLTQNEKMKLVILSKMHGKVKEAECAIRTSQRLLIRNNEIEKENRRFVRSNDTLNKKLTKTLVEKIDLQSQCATLQDEKAMLTEQLNDCRVQICSLEESNQSVTAEQKQALDGIQNLQAVIFSKGKDLRQFAEQVANLESSLEEIKTQNKELQDQLEAERDRCTDLDKDLGDMKESHESLLAEKMELTITLRAKVETVKAHDEQLARKSIKIFELEKESSCHLEQFQTAASALETSESALAACQNEVAASVDESRARGMKVEQLVAELSESKAQVTSLTEKLGTVTDYLSSGMKKLEDVEQNRDELKESLKAGTATLDVSERKLAEATSKNEALKAAMEELRSSWNACKERSNKTCKYLLQVEEQQSITSEQLQKVKEEYSRMSIAKQQLEEKLQEKFTELAECTDVRSEAQKVEIECLKFKELAAQTEVQRKDLSADLSNKEQKLRQIVDARETLRGKYMQVGKEKEEAVAHCAQLSEALAQAQEGHTALSADLSTMTAKYVKFRDENVNLEGILADLQVKNQSLQQTKDFLHVKNGEMKSEILLLKQVSEDLDSLKLVHESVKHRLADLQDKHIAVEGENRHLRKLKRAERELKRDQETVRKSMQEIKEVKLRLQGREEAFDGVKSIVAISQNIERKQERLQKQQSHIISKAHAFAVGTQEKIGLSIEENMQVYHQLFKQQCTAATEHVQLCMGNLPEQVLAAVREHSTHLAQEKQEQLEQHMTDLITGVVKTVTKNHSSSLAHMVQQCQELEEQLREHQQATKKGTNEVLTLQRRQLDETRNLADSSERGSENVCVVSPKVCCEIQSFQDVMIPYLLSLAYNHNFTDTTNTGLCTDISELEAVCDLKALTVIDIGSLDPRCASFLPSIHPYCTKTVITVIKNIWGVYEALPYQIFSFSYLHASDKLYMYRLLLAVVPRMLTNIGEKRLKSDILYTLARVPLNSALKLKVNMEALFSPRWHTGKDAQYLYQKYDFNVLPVNVQCVAEQLELDISRKLYSQLQIALPRQAAALAADKNQVEI